MPLFKQVPYQSLYDPNPLGWDALPRHADTPGLTVTRDEYADLTRVLPEHDFLPDGARQRFAARMLRLMRAGVSVDDITPDETDGDTVDTTLTPTTRPIRKRIPYALPYQPDAPDWNQIKDNPGIPGLDVTRDEYEALRRILPAWRIPMLPDYPRLHAPLILDAIRHGDQSTDWLPDGTHAVDALRHATTSASHAQTARVTLAGPAARSFPAALHRVDTGLFTGCMQADDPEHGPIMVTRADGRLAPGIANITPDADNPGVVEFGPFTPFKPELLRMDKLQVLKVLEESAEFVDAAKTHMKHPTDRAARLDMLDELADTLQALANTMAALHVTRSELDAAKDRVNRRNTVKHRYDADERDQYDALTASDRGGVA